MLNDVMAVLPLVYTLMHWVCSAVKPLRQIHIVLSCINAGLSRLSFTRCVCLQYTPAL
jgi:hypothetical protein